MSELNKDFEQVAEKINAKIKEVAAVLKELNELRDKSGLDSLIFSAWMREETSRKLRQEGLTGDELYDKMDAEAAKYEAFDVSPIESELGQAGWSTSSSYC